MHLFLTSVLPFLGHDHASAAAFLTCRHHNFHSSIVPEFLSDEERVQKFCAARQQNQVRAGKGQQYTNLYNLFVQTPLMQFSPSLVLCPENSADFILKSLLETKYFTRTLQRCFVSSRVPPTADLLQSLSKVQSLTKLDLRESEVEIEHLEIITNSFPSLETMTIHNSVKLRPSVNIDSPPPPATKTLRNLTMHRVDASFVTQFVPHFTNLRKLVLAGHRTSDKLNLLLLSSSLSLVTDLSLAHFNLENTESLKNLVHLSTLHFTGCKHVELSFLTQENSLPQLVTLSLVYCEGLSTSSFASLAHAPNLHVLKVVSHNFNNDGLRYLENMIHLRKLDLSASSIIGDSRSLKTLMQNLFQLEALHLEQCRGIGGQAAIAGALYSTHSRLRVLNLRCCFLVDDDLNGIGALRNTLELLDLADNGRLTNEALIFCKDLEKLKVLNLESCFCVDDLSPLKGCVNLEDLNLHRCTGLVGASFKVFSEEPNSFSNLRRLNLSSCYKLTDHIFEHLARNNHLVYQLKEVNVSRISEILSSPAARNNICQLKGLRSLTGIVSDLCGIASSKELQVMGELVERLTNIEDLD